MPFRKYIFPFIQNGRESILNEEDELEKEEEKRKKRQELFEKERQQRKEKLNEWKVFFFFIFTYDKVSIPRQPESLTINT